MQKRILFKLHHSLTMLTLKRLLLTASMCCLMTAVNAAPIDDAIAARFRGDYAQALKIFKPLATQGHAQAQLNLGVMYDNGKGVTQHYKEAMKWYRLAAEQGNPSAQYHLGSMYFEGRGVTQDYIRAHMWWNLMSAASRDIVAERMTPQQIEKAQDMARACEVRNFKGC